MLFLATSFLNWPSHPPIAARFAAAAAASVPAPAETATRKNCRGEESNRTYTVASKARLPDAYDFDVIERG